jgi:homoserine O-succinyltransferase/O-acetyltransferase
VLTIGILNSMPHAAVRSTERQFIELLTEAAGADVLALKWFSLQPRDGYQTSHELWATEHLDGLIATGTEPKAQRLCDEPYWPAFTRTVDWATCHTTSTIWSCLGAHAAVLHLDRVQRQPFEIKLHGVFAITKQERHPLLEATDPSWGVPHSRWNELPSQALRACGYRLLTHSGEAGVDLFVKTCGQSLFVFLQGHPEYDARALWREYRRDVLRFLTGEREDYPRMPAHYFDLTTERRLRMLRERALADRHPDIMVDMQLLGGKADLAATWKTAAVQLYRNWLNILIAQRAKPLAQVASLETSSGHNDTHS